MYRAYITRIKNLRKHSNADRLQCGECFGNTVIVSMSTQPDELGVYFPVDGRIGVEYAEKNDLLRRKDENGNPAGGYLDPEKRNIKALKLRGEQSDGLFMPLSSLSGFTDTTLLKEGDTISVLCGVTICEKYVPRSQPRQRSVGTGNRTRRQKHHAPIAPLFMEHVDTEQLAYNLGSFRAGDQVEITLKMHGTSQRTGYLPVRSGYRRTLLDRLLRREGKPVYDWGYVTGTRRVVLDTYDGGYYGNNAFREQHSKAFEGKLRKGETAYYEVVGFTDTGAPIMPSAENKKVDKLMGDKSFSSTFGDKTVFSYGCEPDGLQSACYVYRMTMTNEDGDVVEYPPDYMRYRCEQMGIACVPLLCRAVISGEGIAVYAPIGEEYSTPFETDCVGDAVREIAERYYDGPDPIGKTHVREGVVIRIVNRPKFTAYKHKNFSFRVLEGMVKEQAQAPDMEEAEESAAEAEV